MASSSRKETNDHGLQHAPQPRQDPGVVMTIGKLLVAVLIMVALLLVATHQNRQAVCRDQMVTGYCR